VTAPPPERPDWLALIAVAITVVIHEILTALDRRPNVFFIVGVSLFWASFAIVRAGQDRGIVRKWGFSTANLLPATAASALIFAVAAALLAAHAWSGDNLRFPAHTFVLMLVYPVWGVMQQFVTLAVVVSNLERVPELADRRLLVWFVGVLLFGVIHAYDARLAVGTAVLEMAVIPLYWRFRNLWPLGVLHGWTGALFYLWGLNIDMWALTFGPRP
jgi:uncharacterized protein